MKSIRVQALAATALLAFAAGSVRAQELKIGYVNSDRVLREAVPAKAAQAKLEAEFSKREKELTEVGNRLKAAGEKLDKDAPTLAETERSRRQRDPSHPSTITEVALTNAVAGMPGSRPSS